MFAGCIVIWIEAFAPFQMLQAQIFGGAWQKPSLAQTLLEVACEVILIFVHYVSHRCVVWGVVGEFVQIVDV